MKVKLIKEFPNYIITSSGKVINRYAKKVLQPSFDKDGYCIVKLSGNGRAKDKKLHRLVAEHFCDKPDCDDKDLTVDHLDANRTNNRAENLEWVSRAENTLRAKAHAVVIDGIEYRSKREAKRKLKIGDKKLQELLDAPSCSESTIEGS